MFVYRKRELGRHDESRSPSPDEDKMQEVGSDPRLRRLLAARIREREADSEEEEAEEDRVARLKRRRRVQEPEVVEEDEEKKVKVEKQESDDEDDDEESDDSDSSDEELDEDAIARRRELMRQKALYKAQAGDIMVREIINDILIFPFPTDDVFRRR